MDRRVVERDDGAFRDRSELAEHVEQLLLEARVERGQLLDLDHEANLAESKLDDFLEQRNLFALAGVELAQLRGSVVSDEPFAVGRSVQGVVVDDHQAPVR